MGAAEEVPGTCCDDSGGIAFLVEVARDLRNALPLNDRTVPDRLILRLTKTLEKIAEEVLAAALVVDWMTCEAACKGLFPLTIAL